MLSKIKKILLFSGLIFFLSIFLHEEASAVFFNGVNYTDMIPTRADVTNWQIKMTYYDALGDIQAGPVKMYMTLGSAGNHYNVWELDGKPEVNDYITWHTACVDPSTPVSTNALNTPDGRYYTTTWDAGCHYGSQASAKYAGCYGLSSGTNYDNWTNPYTGSSYSGGVLADGQCPYFQNSNSYCTIGGLTQWGYFNSYNSGTYPYPCKASACGGSGSCTRYVKYCDGNSYCYRPSTAYSSACGGAALSGTSMCSSSSYSCSPPAPTVTTTTSCVNGNPQISVNWTAPSHSDGTYDLRWRPAGGSFTNVCTPAKPFVVSSGLTQGQSYEFDVRGNTTSGYNGPTAFGTTTVTAPSCVPAPTCSISANPTTIYAGQTSAITNTGAAGAGGAPAVYSYPAPSTGTTDNVNSTSTTYHAPASVASTTTATVNAKVCNTVGGSCTSCSTSVTVNATSTKTINVYQDLNGNGVKDAGENGYSGATVNVTGKGAGTYTTDASGQVIISGLTAGSSTVTLTIPSGWKSTTTNPESVTFPPSQTDNFGIQPPAPVCSGGLTASPTTVNPGQNSTLTANGCTAGGQGGSLTYSWLTPAPGSITSTNPSVTNTATWASPNPYWTDTYAYPSVNVCQTGTALCTPYAVSNGVGVGNHGIHIIPLFSISGNVFVDQNKDGLQNGTDANYSNGITITSTGGNVTLPAPAGNYLVSNLVGGVYTISYTSLPSGYQMTYPKNGPPPSFTVRVGNVSTGGACSNGGSNSATCDANGNITLLRYGISNSIPWIQSIGGDITGTTVTDPSGGGFTDPIPTGASCGVYASLTGGGGSPGVIYSGAGSYSFGAGQASQNPYNWVVGGLNYPEPINITSPLITNYSYVYSEAQQSGNVKDISSYCGAGGIASCQLPANLANGFYTSSGDLTLTGPSYTFPAAKNFVILVNGDLNIKTEIHVPIGSTAFFTTAGNINVDKSVGEASVNSTRSNIEGYFSTDKSFYVQGNDSCPTADLRANIAGAVVVNASLTGGTFVNQRDLCASDLQCPAISIIERPDFVLYSPEYLKIRRVWQEVAP